MGSENFEVVKQHIVDAKEASAAFLENIKDDPSDFKAVHANLRSFVLYRFFLMDDDPQTDSIDELSRMRLRKLAEINKRGMLQDLSNNCVGVSSETMKKALLIMTLQKQLGIVFDSEENDTLAQLAQSIVRQLAS